MNLRKECKKRDMIISCKSSKNDIVREQGQFIRCSYSASEFTALFFNLYLIK